MIRFQKDKVDTRIALLLIRRVRKSNINSAHLRGKLKKSSLLKEEKLKLVCSGYIKRY